MATKKNWAALGVGALLVVGVSLPAVGAMSQTPSGSAIVGARQKAMRDMQVPRGYFLSQGQAAAPDFATVLAQAAIVRANLVLAKGSFPANTKKGGDVEGADIRAKDTVWSEWNQVSAIFDSGVVAADQIKAAADAKDKTALYTAAQALNKACSDCHTKYRE